MYLISINIVLHINIFCIILIPAGNLPVVVIPEGATTITISHLLLPNEGTLGK